MKQEAALFKALSEETRLRILALLCHGELCVCDLMAVLDLAQSTTSRHLAYLRNAGWVEDRRQGVWMYYCLAPEDNSMRQDVTTILADRLKQLPQVKKDLAALEKYLRTKKTAGC